MVKVYAARSLPVNPTTTTFILKRSLLWEALQRKIRNATEFVPAMKECKVLKDENDVVLRDCVLQMANGEMRNMREEVSSYGKQFIVFRQMEGSVTSNILSNGPENNDQDLQLTYVFEWNYPNIEQGTKEHAEIVEKTGQMALMAVRESINQARKLAKDGSLRVLPETS